MEPYYLGRCVLTVVGVVIFLIGLRLTRRALRLSRAGVRARATVVAYEGDEDGRFPVVEYEDRSHTRHRVRLFWGASTAPAVGAAMEVVYDPDEPGRVRGVSSSDLWFVAASCVWWGVALVVLAWVGEPAGEQGGRQ